MMFSIIVPIYNIQEYIGECIESILCQTYKDFELILVDDGSTDESKEVIKQYAINDNRIVCIFQENQGPGAARNNALRKARGEYVIFIDGDDFLTDRLALEQILNHININTNVDIVVHPLKRMSTKDYIIHNSLVSYDDSFNKKINFVDTLDLMLTSGKILSSPCEMIFKRNFLLENKLFFPEGVFSEDIEWIIRIMKNSPRTLFINYQFYCYRFDRVGSTCNSDIDPNKIKRIISFLNKHYFELIQDKSSRELSDKVLNYLAYQWCVCASNISKVKNKEKREELFIELSKSIDVLKYRQMKKVKIFSCCKNILGIKLASNLGKIRYYLKRRTL